MPKGTQLAVMTLETNAQYDLADMWTDLELRRHHGRGECPPPRQTGIEPGGASRQRP